MNASITATEGKYLLKSSQNSPIQPEQENQQINRKKPSYSCSSKRNGALHTSASVDDTISCHQLLIGGPFFKRLSSCFAFFVFLLKCFQAPLGFFSFLCSCYYFRALQFLICKFRRKIMVHKVFSSPMALSEVMH